jgi:hypothetical protein
MAPDPTAAIAPSADLVLWSRLGSSYDPADLTKALLSEAHRGLGPSCVMRRRCSTTRPALK